MSKATSCPGHREIYYGDSRRKFSSLMAAGKIVERDGEQYYKISNYHVMPAFFLSVVSGSDHWMFVSSSGGLTCGRREPDNALFPYYTDDKIHDASATTGPNTILLVEKSHRTFLWQPLGNDLSVYAVERNLYKNLPGNKLIFEEVNHDLELVFSYTWSCSESFGFVRKSQLVNNGVSSVQISLLDGLRNLLPYGVNRNLQNELSTLVDAYKQAQAVSELALGIYTMSSILTDRAEPSEALKASIVWSTGLGRARILLSDDQVTAFQSGSDIEPEDFRMGKRGSFYVNSELGMEPGDQRCWYILADVEQSPSQVPAMMERIRRGVSFHDVEESVQQGTRRLLQLAGSSDGVQCSSDALVTGRHFSNTLFNIMRGGVFCHDYQFPLTDFLNFAEAWNKPLRSKFETALKSNAKPLTLASANALAVESGDADMMRIVFEYLPLIFSRRHGDPSRPWNHFLIDLRNSEGSDNINYQGNWRDIFQNWDALAISYPEFIESFIAKFVNASTADGYNPYRISRDGFDWETLDADNDWSNIGYWGDHQVGYLVRLLALSNYYHPGRLNTLLGREIFVYADIPYRIKTYQELKSDPRNSVFYDDVHAQLIAERVARTGADGKLVTLGSGAIHKVNLFEKLLLTALVKIGNLVPGGGIWMNTQRPEWNDANNALVGYGLSMVTLCYLRSYLSWLLELLNHESGKSFEVSTEVIGLFGGTLEVLQRYKEKLAGVVSAGVRKSFMDEIVLLGEGYRAKIYNGFCGDKSSIETHRLLKFIGLALDFLDHSIAQNRRPDGLYHAYNLIRFDTDGYEIENLEEMLEGQVAVLSSGYLDAAQSLELLKALKSSRLYRGDQNSYMLYPDQKLPLFTDKNVIPPELLAGFEWLNRELEIGNCDYVQQDINGVVHFNGRFKNVNVLLEHMDQDPRVGNGDSSRLRDIYESVFRHRRFTGRSSTMYKYEGLGCIYWHMVSKLSLATAETIIKANDAGCGQSLHDQLHERFIEIQDGLGVHKSPADYGAFPLDAYSHTPAFAGVQQPGLTGQVKEDLIIRFCELGVRVREGEIFFEPTILNRNEFLDDPISWVYLKDGELVSEELPAGALAFTICGVPVIYRLAQSASICVYLQDREPVTMEGPRLEQSFSQSVFKRDTRVRKLVVELDEALLGNARPNV